MMLALGIFTLIASLVITNIDTILSSTNEQSLQQIIKSAVRESRYLAAIHKRPTYLGFNYEIIYLDESETVPALLSGLKE